MRTPFIPVIRSLLDTDLYKVTMWQAFLHRFPRNQAEYRFVCRNQTLYGLGELKDELILEIEGSRIRITDYRRLEQMHN